MLPVESMTYTISTSLKPPHLAKMSIGLAKRENIGRKIKLKRSDIFFIFLLPDIFINIL